MFARKFFARHAASAVVPNASSIGMATPDPAPLGSPSVSSSWAIAQQGRKQGAGVLLFAYGSQVTLQHFLGEGTEGSVGPEILSAKTSPKLRVHLLHKGSREAEQAK